VSRTFWVGVGVGLTIWGLRWARRQRQRYGPDAVTARVSQGLRDLRELVALSLEEGRRAAAEKEAELRASFPD
jgi:hypothetical protein